MLRLRLNKALSIINIRDKKRNKVTKGLLELSYPEINLVRSLSLNSSKTKLFVSCAIEEIGK